MPSQLYLFADDRLTPVEMPAARPLRWAAWQGDRCLLVGNGGTALWYDGRRFEALDTGTKQNLRGAAFSPDRSEALLVGNRGLVLHHDGRNVRKLASPAHENLRRVAWHPDGDYALIVGNAGTVLRYEDGSLTPVPGDRAHTLRTVSWRPGGAYALVGAYASQFAGYPRPHALYKCDGLYLQALLTSDDVDDFVAVDWHPTGAQALIAGYAYGEHLSNKLLTYDGAGFATHAVEASGALLGAAWHPGGDYALLCGENGALLRYASTALRAGSGRVEQIASGTKDNLVGPFWNPNGASALLLRGPSERVYTV